MKKILISLLTIFLCLFISSCDCCFCKKCNIKTNSDTSVETVKGNTIKKKDSPKNLENKSSSEVDVILSPSGKFIFH